MRDICQPDLRQLVVTPFLQTEISLINLPMHDVSNSQKMTIFSSVGLDAHIPLKTKEKFWQDHYIDLSVLLDPDEQGSYSLNIRKDDDGNFLFLMPNNEKAKLSLGQ